MARNCWHHPPYGEHIHCNVEGCKAVCQPCSVGDGLHRSSPHTPAEHEACECGNAEPVERITDDLGDEEEHGEHKPGECSICDAARQQDGDETCPHKCMCTSDDECPHDCDCVTARQQDGGA